MSILELLEEKRVLAIRNRDNKSVELIECADWYFRYTLTKSQLTELIYELTKLHDSLQE